MCTPRDNSFLFLILTKVGRSSVVQERGIRTAFLQFTLGNKGCVVGMMLMLGVLVKLVGSSSASAADLSSSAIQLRMPSYTMSEKSVTVLIAAIQAQKLTTLNPPPRPLVMDKMSQAQMVLSLRSCGEEPPKGWTKVQLLARLKELEDAGDIKPPGVSGKKQTPLEASIKELNRAGIRKASLQKYVTDECGLTITGNETMTILQQKAMTHLLQHTDPVGEDKMGFGKYAAQDYATVKQNDPQYCVWATTTAREGECSQYLRRFVKWLQKAEMEPKETKVDLGKIIPLAKAKGYGKKNPGTENPTTGKTMMAHTTTTPSTATTATPSTATSSTATSSAGSDPMVQQLLQAVMTLTKEVQELKDEKSEKPRKIAAKADEIMENADTQDRR